MVQGEEKEENGYEGGIVRDLLVCAGLLVRYVAENRNPGKRQLKWPRGSNPSVAFSKLCQSACKIIPMAN